MLGYTDKDEEGLLGASKASPSHKTKVLACSVAGAVLVFGLLAIVGPSGPSAAAGVNTAVVLGEQEMLSKGNSATTAKCSNGAWKQCGGKDFTGQTCCSEEDHCDARSLEYSQCVPNCLTPTWTQCGGLDFKGDTCCKPNDHCIVRDSDFSQCVPKPAAVIPAVVAVAAEATTPVKASVEVKGVADTTAAVPESRATLSADAASKGAAAEGAAAESAAACSNGAWMKCGGKDFTGHTCCSEEDHCMARSPEFSQCVPNCLTLTYHQCGGLGFKGDSCCKPDDHCIVRDSDFSQCVPKCANSPWGQCGGKYFSGRDCCPRGFECDFHDAYLSTCLPVTVATAVATVSIALPQSAVQVDECKTLPWNQCGGNSFGANMCCPHGYACVYRSEDFSQCAAL